MIDEIDVLDIVTPTSSHFSYALKAIENGVNVFIEKPVCSNTEESLKLVEKSKLNNVKIQVGHVERFNPAFTAVENNISKPMFIESHRLAQFNPRGTDVSVVLDLMILDNDIIVTATCVRVPVRTGHSESINIEFEKSYDFENVIKILNNAPGCKVIDERRDGGYITPLEAEGDYTTYISRIRKDNSNVKAINIWVVSDNLLKGAALNTVQIAEHLVKKL